MSNVVSQIESIERQLATTKTSQTRRAQLEARREKLVPVDHDSWVPAHSFVDQNWNGDDSRRGALLSLWVEAQSYKASQQECGDDFPGRQRRQDRVAALAASLGVAVPA